MRHAASAPPRSPARVTTIVVLVVVALVGLLAGGGLLWSNWQLSRVPTFSAGRPLPGPGAGVGAPAVGQPIRLPAAYEGVTTFLIFSTGSAGMTPQEARRYGVPDLQARHGDRLTDTIMLAVLDTRQRQLSLLSIPRDTWLDWRGRRINETYLREGPAQFAADVTRLTGIPVNHMVAVSFTAAGRLVDTVDGVDIRIPVPMRDAESHLLLPQAGCVHLDGRVALAFARSRHTQVLTTAGWVTDPSASDFGRNVRQQAVVVAALNKLLSPRLPTLLPALARTARETLIIDAGLNLGEVATVGRVLATGQPLRVHHYGMPSRVTTIGGASVVLPDPPRAAEVLAPLHAAVPGSIWPDWLPAPSSPSATGAPGPTSSAQGSDTSVIGRDTPVTVRGYDLGTAAAYAPCSAG